jgi:signal transduction histidine kinase/CheY-like chemotaxis protein
MTPATSLAEAPHRARRRLDPLPRGGLLPPEVWLRRHRAIVVLLWLHAAVIAAVVVAKGYGLTHTFLEGGLVALCALLASLPNTPRTARAMIASFGLLSSSAILVHLSGGYIEMHFHFFVMIIVISLYQEWWPFLLAIAYVVFHHGVIGVIDPASVYNHADAVAEPWRWSAIHGIFILAASIASMGAWRLNEDLVQDRIAIALRARAAAEESARLREEFLSVATHELRTPITGLKAYAELGLRLLARDADPAQLRATLERLDGQTDRLARLVTQLLDVSRLEAGKLDLEIVPVDLGRLVREQVELARQRSDAHSWSVTAPDGIVVAADPGRIEQAVMNLLENALRYGPDGGPIEVRVTGDASRATVEVADRGIGIPADRIGHVFDRFFQAHSERNYGGMGLGLFITRQIVERHGGEVAAAARPGGGTSFTIGLPRADVGARVEAAPPRRDWAVTASARPPGPILVVEDDDAIRRAVREILTEEGLEVVEARDGAAALERLATVEPAVILVDKLMPVLNGTGFAQAYRLRPGPHAPLIGLCAARDAVAWSREIGAVACVPKPFAVADLVAAVRSALSGAATPAG